MNDTSPKMQKLYCQLLKKKSYEERLKIGFSLFETSKKLMISGIKARHPNLTESQLRKELFIRMYKSEFKPEPFQKILSELPF